MPISKIPVGAIQSGTIGTSQIADNAVTTAKILNDNVTSAKIPNSAVGSTEIASDAVTGDKIGTEYKSAPKGTFSYIEHLAKAYKDLPWFPKDDEPHNPKENIYDLYNDIIKPYFSYGDKRGQFIRAEE